ncbi:J domain-containing protein [Marinicellulosiphila megalodicopiae]|uniref:J domain-containing protein n=1 Tax=Marinicellulosiphila megalodicopiae TaxID=2724896 RepID=UPI003BB0ECCA
MSVERNYYDTLGVIEDADLKVIKAAYKALVSIYHPDRNPDPNSAEKIYEINEAYDVLSDTEKRRAYDLERNPNKHNATPTHFSTQEPFSKDPIEQDWYVAEGFFPLLKTQFAHLSKISWNLAFAFRLELLDSQKFSESKRIFNEMKFAYLSKYFGKNPDILWFAEQLIINKHVQAALNVNNYIKVMGKSITIGSVREKINELYPQINIPTSVSVQEKHFKNLYRYVKHPIKTNQPLALESIEYFAKHQKATLKKNWRGRYSIQLENNNHNFNDFNELTYFIVDAFEKEYGLSF